MSLARLSFRTLLFYVLMVLRSYQPIVAIFYKENKTNPYVHKLFKVKHEVEEIGQELFAIVDNGGVFKIP